MDRRAGIILDPRVLVLARPSQITILWTVTLTPIAMLAVVRAHALEPIFGGLDRAVHLHRVIGLAALLLLVAHVMFLAVDGAEDGRVPATC